MLLAEDLPEDQLDSVSDGRGTPGNWPPIALTAPVEFLLLDRISLALEATPSGNDATEARLLLGVDRGRTISAVSGFVKRLSMNDRK
jgi:hypothetical protein